MDQCTHEVSAEYWKGIIRACGQRPARQSAKSWMEDYLLTNELPDSDHFRTILQSS